MNIPEFYRLLQIFKFYFYRLINVQYYSVYDLQGRVGDAAGDKLLVDSYHPFSSFIGTTKGRTGGSWFIWSPTTAKSTHNGITIFSPTVPWDGTTAGLLDYHAKVGETDTSGSGCWLRVYTELDISMAGAVGGLTGYDNAPLIENCLNIDTSSGGSVVYIRDGTWYVSSTIDFPSGKNDRAIVGQGRRALLYRDADYGDTFSIHGNSTTGVMLFRPCVRDLRVSSNAATTSGSQFNLEGISNLTLENIYVSNGFKLFTFNGVSGYIKNIYGEITSIYGGTVTGRKFMEFGDASATYAHPSCSDLFLDNINVRCPTGSDLVEYGFDFLSADGIWIKGGHSGYSTGATVRFNPSGTSTLNLVWFADFMFDETLGYATYFDGAPTGVYTNIFFDNCSWKGGSGNTLSGFATSATCNAFSVYVNGGSIIQFAQNGVEINSPDFRGIHFTDVDVRGNSRSSSGTYSGYKLADNTRDINIVGGASGGDDNKATDANTQKYGIEGGTGHSRIYVRGTDLSGNLTQPINVNPGNGIHLIGCPVGNGIIADTESTKLIGYHKTGVDASGVVRQLQISGDGASAGAFIARHTNDDLPSSFALLKSKGAIGAHGSAASGTDIGRFSFEASDGTNWIRAAYILAEVDGTPGANDMPGRIGIYTTPDGSATPTEKLRIAQNGFCTITGSLGLGAPVIKTADFTVADTENFLINNKLGSGCVVTLPAAASWTGRPIKILNYQAQTVTSASANVVPIDGTAASAAILAATAGKYATLVSDGTNWLIMEAN
jgi:hypothetical protein